MPVGCVNHYTASASCWSLKYRNNWSGLAFYTSAEFYSEMAQHSYSCRRVQRNVHGYTTLWLVFNFSSFPPWPMKIEVWPVFKLRISTGLQSLLIYNSALRSACDCDTYYIGLKTSNDLALVSRGISIKCVLCDLYYVSYIIAERLAGGCPCMLVP